jgi:RimJ/RimL family protein N-acetyltransferase
MSLTLCKATLNHSDLLLTWRNDPDVITMSASGKAVTEAEHDRWLVKVLSDKSWHLYIAEINIPVFPTNFAGEVRSIGMGRINDEHGVAVLSYSVAREHRGKGLAGELVAVLCDKACELGYTSIQAVARHRNTASIKALLSNGFTIQDHELLTLKK